MSPKLWSDENRLFIPRLGGWTINFKYIARKLGWVKTPCPRVLEEGAEDSKAVSDTAEERRRRSIERSRFEDR